MDKRGVIVIGGLVLSGAILLTSKKSRASSNPYGATAMLSKNFVVGEWLHSSEAPELINYVLTPVEFSNLQSLVQNIMQPLRDKYGPIYISGGARPPSFRTSKDITVTSLITGKPVVVPAGSSIDVVIAAKGYKPADTSDHHNFAAADFQIIGRDEKGNPVPDATKMDQAFSDLRANPSVRQVILYRGSDNKPVHIHVAVIYTGHNKEPGAIFAFEDKEPSKQATA